jgi:hypothetical protein
VAPCPGDRRARQFTATGTAVRAAGGLRATSPFLASLAAQDFVRVVLGATDAHTTVHNLGPGRGAGGYCIAEVTLTGTAIAQFRPSASPRHLPALAMDLRASTQPLLTLMRHRLTTPAEPYFSYRGAGTGERCEPKSVQ